MSRTSHLNRPRIRLASVVSAAVLSLGVATAARAAVTITRTAAPAPTYGVKLNFDEVGGPTGQVPNNSWAGAPWGITNFQSGDGVANDVANHAASTGQGTNSYSGVFGVYMDFSKDLSAMSVQWWDDSGPASPFGGGAGIHVFNDGVEVATNFGTPAWGGIGNSWYNITTTGGSTFDHIEIAGNSFFPTTIVDNISYTPVPEPTSVALIGVAALCTLRRRRGR